MSKPDETVKVVVRVRPLFGEEIPNNNLKVVTCYPETNQISIKNPKDDSTQDFFFDAVYDDTCSDNIQKHIYDTCAAGVVDGVMKGYNGTIFAYGQTGAGGCPYNPIHLSLYCSIPLSLYNPL
jgi:kinesin family protein 5